MKLFLTAVLILGASVCHAIPPSYLVLNTDGTSSIVFPSKDDVVVSTGAITESPIPTEIDINISTCSYRFDSYSDFLKCYKKKGVKEQIILIRERLNKLSDQGSNDPEVVDLKQRLDWLKSYRDSLGQ